MRQSGSNSIEVGQSGWETASLHGRALDGRFESQPDPSDRVSF